MDKALIAHKFSQSLGSYNHEAKAQKIIIARLVEIFDNQRISTFKTIFEFGTGTGLLSQKIHQKYKYSQLFLNDLTSEFESVALSNFTDDECQKITFLSGDVEQIKLPENCDLIISSSTEQWIENKDKFYKLVSNSLSANGYFVFSSFALENLKELREATGISLKYYSIEDTKKMLSKYFHIISAEEQHIRLHFNSALDILTHIKKTGVNAISKQKWTRKSVKELIKKIELVSRREDSFQISYHPTYFILKKK